MVDYMLDSFYTHFTHTLCCAYSFKIFWKQNPYNTMSSGALVLFATGSLQTLAMTYDNAIELKADHP